MSSDQSGEEPEQPRQPVYIVMGVAGSGKTTVGSLLAERLNIPFYDADDFHPAENLAKLRAGKALSEDDREPWLKDLSDNLRQWAQGRGAVLACSALKRSYRTRFREAAPSACFIYLYGPPEIVARRLRRRSLEGGHVISDYQQIMQDQFDKLEVPANAFLVNIDQSPREIVDDIVARLKAAPGA